jgi:hypothetical protein
MNAQPNAPANAPDARALEGLAKLVGSLSEGQQAYAQSLEAAAKLTLSGDCDGASMRPAMAALAALPRAMGAAHSQLAALLRGLADGVRRLLREYQAACKEIRSGAHTVRRPGTLGRGCAGGRRGPCQAARGRRARRSRRNPRPLRSALCAAVLSAAPCLSPCT